MGTTDELVDGDVVGRLQGVLLAPAPGPGSGWPALAGAAATVVGLPLRRRVDVVRDAIVHDVEADPRRPRGRRLEPRRPGLPGVGDLARLAPRTTRVLHPGRHGVELQVNGQRYGPAWFDLVG